jgi:SAM-dependent methyltransferase
MIIPDNAVRYILLQRTHYIKLQRNFIIKLIKKLLPSKYNYTALIDFEILIRKSAIINDYIADMEAEYSDIKSYLPSKAKNILDIGCGIGGINIFLSQHYKSQETTHYCLDKSQIDNIYYGFKERAAFYNSLEITREFLSVNGINKINLLPANDNNTIETSEKFDLILSLISWGFHYPVEIYLDQAYTHLNGGGHLIIDIRKNTKGLNTIKEKFGNITTISETEKKTRILAIKIL